MGRRHRGREFAVQVLFQMDMTRDAPEDVLPTFWEGPERRRTPGSVRGFTEKLVRGTWERRADIDAFLGASSEHWRLDRMAVVDRNILRLATFELLQGDETPAAVIIDEAIEIAKRYGNEDSGAFVNGVLDAVRRRLATEADATG